MIPLPLENQKREFKRGLTYLEQNEFQFEISENFRRQVNELSQNVANQVIKLKMDLKQIKSEMDLNKTNFELIARSTKEEYDQMETMLQFQYQHIGTDYFILLKKITNLSKQKNNFKQTYKKKYLISRVNFHKKFRRYPSNFLKQNMKRVQMNLQKNICISQQQYIQDRLEESQYIDLLKKISAVEKHLQSLHNKMDYRQDDLKFTEIILNLIKNDNQQRFSDQLFSVAREEAKQVCNAIFAPFKLLMDQKATNQTNNIQTFSLALRKMERSNEDVQESFSILKNQLELMVKINQDKFQTFEKDLKIFNERLYLSEQNFKEDFQKMYSYSILNTKGISIKSLLTIYYRKYMNKTISSVIQQRNLQIVIQKLVKLYIFNNEDAQLDNLVTSLNQTNKKIIGMDKKIAELAEGRNHFNESCLRTLYCELKYLFHRLGKKIIKIFFKNEDIMKKTGTIKEEKEIQDQDPLSLPKERTTSIVIKKRKKEYNSLSNRNSPEEYPQLKITKQMFFPQYYSKSRQHNSSYKQVDYCNLYNKKIGGESISFRNQKAQINELQQRLNFSFQNQIFTPQLARRQVSHDPQQPRTISNKIPIFDVVTQKITTQEQLELIKGNSLVEKLQKKIFQQKVEKEVYEFQN